MDLLNFVHRLREYASLVLHAPDVDGEFYTAVRQLIDVRSISLHLIAPMDQFITIAHQKLPFVDGLAKFQWRMLYIDASILKVLARASISDLREDTARECISTLDRAIIIAGATDDDGRRDYIVHDVIKQLQSIVPWRNPSGAVLNIAKSAPPVPPSPTSKNSICILAALPSIAATQKQWSRTPFVIRGFADDWPAMHQPRQWASLSYLSSVTGPGRIVPVEVGDDYRADNWSQRLISWEEFLSSLDPSAHRHHHTLYLAQHNLLMQFPRLRQDIILPDLIYAYLDSPDFPAYVPPPDVLLNAWLGPKGTISPAHTDPFFNCYVQVVGRKTVWLAPPAVTLAMYPAADKNHNPAANTTSPLLSNTSRVDVFPMTTHEIVASQTAYPLFWETVPDEASCVTLNPGDLLFFPPGWWHAMRSEDVSFSVSMWF